jgi:hypothetical protein
MPKAICPGCFARCSVTTEQIAKRVICPNCECRFTALVARRPRRLAFIAAGVVAIGAVALVAAGAAKKPGPVATPKPTAPAVAIAPTLEGGPVADAPGFPDAILVGPP